MHRFSFSTSSIPSFLSFVATAGFLAVCNMTSYFFSTTLLHSQHNHTSHTNKFEALNIFCEISFKYPARAKEANQFCTISLRDSISQKEKHSDILFQSRSYLRFHFVCGFIPVIVSFELFSDYSFLFYSVWVFLTSGLQ